MGNKLFWTYLSLAIACLLFNLNTLFAQDSLNISTVSTMYGHSAYINKIEIIDNYAYLMSSDIGIFDVSDPNHFMPVSRIRFDHEIFDFIHNGNIAMVSLELDSLIIYDISDRTSPEYMSSIEFDANLRQIDMDGNLLFLRTSFDNDLIQIFDISDPESPELVHEQDELPGYFAVGGNILAITDDDDNVDLYDISNLENFIFTGTFPCRNPYKMQIDGDRLYIRSLQIYDISNPAEPFLAGECDVTSTYIIRDTLLFEADNGLRVFNIADTADIRELGFASMDFFRGPLAVGSGVALIDDYDKGLGRFDISDVTSPDSLGPFWYPECINHVAYSDNHLFIGDDKGLRIVDVNDPMNPVEISTLYLGYGRGGLETIIDGNTAFVNSDWPIHILDISDLANPYHVDTCRTVCAVDDIAYYSNPDLGDFLIESGFHGELEIFDVTDRQNPRSIYNSTRDDVWNICGSLFVDGDYLYWIGSEHGLFIYNLADEDTDWPLATFVSDRWNDLGPNYNNRYFAEILVHDDIAYISEVGYDGAGLCLLDVSDPENPEEISYTEKYGWSGWMQTYGNFLLFPSCIFDVTDIENWIITGRFTAARHAIIQDDYGYLAIRSPDNYIFHNNYYLTIVDCSEALNQPHPPMTFHLLAPADSSTLLPWEIDLAWSASNGVEEGDDVTYDVYVSTSPNAKGTIVAEGLQDTTFHFIAESLEEYWWTVHANDTNTNGIRAVERWSFNTPFTGVESENNSNLPETWSISAIYPNPFNHVMTITVGLPETSYLNVRIFNPLGQQVTELAGSRFSPGYKQFTFDMSDFASGIYFINANVPGKKNETRKLVMLK